MKGIPEKYRKDLAIIRETVAQINRDLNLEGKEVVLSGNEHNAFKEIVEQLKPLIRQLYKEDKHYLKSLLYKVDINEKDYRTAVEIEKGEEIPERLAELIIQREFQKSLTRRFFSGKE